MTQYANDNSISVVCVIGELDLRVVWTFRLVWQNE